jgi:neurotrimin
VIITREFLTNVQLIHSVQWRREDGKDIVVRNEGRDKQCNEIFIIIFFTLTLMIIYKLFQLVTKVIDGERLSLSGVLRSDMGGYLCIASNGIPPSVSKRYDIQVNCKWPISDGFKKNITFPLHGL